MGRELLFSVRISDCEVQTFRAGGKGGQNQNKRSTGVRVVHPPSGARGESREHRGQLQNKRAAFGRMARSDEFQRWARRVALGVEAAVEEQMRPANLVVRTGRSAAEEG